MMSVNDLDLFTIMGTVEAKITVPENPCWAQHFHNNLIKPDNEYSY